MFLRHANGGAAARQVSARFLAQLGAGLLGGVVLMIATMVATLWMAAQQDAAARATSRRMVEGGLESFSERAQAMLLDYAVWTNAYTRIREGNVAWMHANMGVSVDISTFDLVVILPTGGGYPVGWETGSGAEPRADLLDSAALAEISSMLDAVPIDAGVAPVSYVRSNGTLWFIAVARVTPQEGLPPGATDGDLPRLVIGYRVPTAAFSDVRRRFLIEDLNINDAPIPGGQSLALEGPDGAPSAWVTWTAPTPGRAVLRAALVPLVALMLVVAAVAVLVSRELVRTARRLEQALTDVRSADRLKTEFLGNVSHELRTPLGGVIGIAQLLQMRTHDPQSREMLALLLASAHSQLALVDGLLDITRIETGDMKIEAVPFDPAATLDETVRLMAPDVAGKGLGLRVEVEPEVRRRFVGDPLAFRQIVTNLVGNALKFTDRGEIAVDLGQGEAGELKLVVADTGPGIDPAQHERIFERFFQVDGTASRRASGAGLGLAITRALAELMGGGIRVESALGRGTAFIVTLPLPPAPEGVLAA